MAARYSDRAVTITVGAVWSFQINPSPPRPPRQSDVLIVGWIILLTLSRVFFGVVYFNDCPQHPRIPIYLLGTALITLLMMLYWILFYVSYVARPQDPISFFKASMLGSLGNLIYHVWVLAGHFWILSVYSPNYDPAAADGLYCNKTLYLFAFWTAVNETFGILALLAKLCKGLIYCMLINPAGANGDFNSYV